MRSVLHGVLAAALALPPSGARAAVAAASGAVSRDVQSLYESCLQQLDAGQSAQAASCLQDVYAGLVNIEKQPRTDLYYVLADAVAASQAAAASEPRTLCIARKLILDYQSREKVATFFRFRKKVQRMSAAVSKALAEAGLTEEQCAAQPATPGEGAEAPSAAPVDRAPLDPSAPIDAVPQPIDAGEPAADAEPARPDAPGDAPAALGARPRAGPAPRPAIQAAAPRSTRKLQLTAKTDLMDAGFATTIVSVSVVGLGGALWAAKVECDARVGSESPCPSPVPQGVRDAGLALMSIGMAGAFVGLAMRWADQRRQRKLRQAPVPVASPSTVGVVWRGRF